MQWFSRRVLLALVVGPAVLLGASLLPAPALADPPCPYTSLRQTSTQTGYGYTCTDATNNLSSQLFAEAADDCLLGDVITTSLHITEGCRAYSSTQVQVTGYMTYRCMYCMN